MNIELPWYEMAIRLTLTAIAGGLIGLDRGEHGRPAGLRTTILVSLAAAVSMIQANLLLGTVGKAADSFIVLDLMRLPLGVLSGMGFIGGGAILKRGNLIMGVTTAATLWFVTVMGLCFGGGQIALGLSMLGLGLFVLTALRWAERLLIQDRRAVVTIRIKADGPDEAQIREELVAAHFRIVSFGVTYSESGVRQIRCILFWRARLDDSHTPEIVASLAKSPGIVHLQWRP